MGTFIECPKGHGFTIEVIGDKQLSCETCDEEKQGENNANFV